MKILKRILAGIAVLLLLAIISALVLVKKISNSGGPEYHKDIVIEGLTDDVEVFRDERGMPHIYATNEQDLYTVVGYISAQERLWQMDLIRRATTGRLSEIFGPDYIDTDQFLRSLKMNKKSSLVIKNTDQDIINCLQYYVDGVNKYIDEAGNNLPPEFRILRYKPEPWTVEYIANIIGYMGWDLASGNLSGDVFIYKLVEELGEEVAKKLIPYYNYTKSPVYPDFKLSEELLDQTKIALASMNRTADLGLTSFTASNNWVVNGDYSETGMPLFSNDMHLGLSSPGIWIQMHHVIPGELNVTGVIVPGSPFVIAGHNEKIAWGMTNLMVDDIDLYRETLSDDGRKYLFDGKWLDVRIENETIIASGEEQTREIRYTHRGPIISGFRNIDDAELSMRWSGYDLSNEVTAVYLLNRAENWDEFNDAISNFNAISQNVAYADVDGNIGLHAAGGVAIREGHGAFIMPGDTSLYDWQGYVPHDKLPYEFNPVDGKVSSANNKTVEDNYPYYIGTYFAMPYRINRVREMLAEKDKFDTGDFKEMITDRKSDFAATLIPQIVSSLEGTDIEGADREVFEAISQWDGTMSGDLYTPTFFETYKEVLTDNLLQDDMGDFYSDFSTKIKEYYLFMVITGGHNLYIDDIETEALEDLSDILKNSFHKAVDIMVEKYSEESGFQVWEDLHTFTAEHPLATVGLLDKLFKLNVGPFRVGGAGHTVSPYSYVGEFRVNHGASERHIYNTANWDESFSVIPTGISGVPGSEFYCSQTETYCDDGFYKDHFSREAVEAAKKYFQLFKSE